MLQIGTILFPTDDSACAEHAFVHAASLAARWNATIHVLHVMQVPALGGLDQAMPEQIEAALPAAAPTLDAAARLARLTAQAREAGITVPEGAVSEVAYDLSADAAIGRYAEAHGIDLVVMGSHGRTGLDRILMGSVAEAVMRQAPCPVLVVRADACMDAHRTIRRVLVPIDFSPASKQAVFVAAALAAAHGAEIDALHIVEEAVLPTVYGVEPISLRAPQILDEARQALMDLATPLVGGAVPLHIHVALGHAARHILAFADENDIDLIVMPTHGRTGVRRLLLGSVAEAVMRDARCPVLSLRAPASPGATPAPGAVPVSSSAQALPNEEAS